MDLIFPPLALAAIGYILHSFATTTDKKLANLGHDPVKISMRRLFCNSLIMIFFAIAYFGFNFSIPLLSWGLLLGVLNALSWIIYYIILKKNVTIIVPLIQSFETTMLFFLAVILFNEAANPINYFGIFLMAVGVYTLLTNGSFKLPHLSRIFIALLFMAILDISYALIVKKILTSLQAFDVALAAYVSTAFFLLLYEMVREKKHRHMTNMVSAPFSAPNKKIFAAAFFGSTGTILIYLALATGEASKIYALAGLHSLAVFTISVVFLKEKITKYRFIGFVLCLIGLALVQI